MIKQTITYEGFDGEQVTEELCFHLSTNQLLEMEFGHEAGLGEQLQSMLEEKNLAEVLRIFKEIVMKAYGTRNGNRFHPASKEEAEEFINSPAFDAFFQELLMNPPKATAFIEGMVPKQVLALAVAGKPVDNLPAWAAEGRDPTPKELMNMPHEDLLEAYRRKSGKPAD